MTATILGCGPTLQHAKLRGLVVGSNDCEKHGAHCDVLVLANAPSKFKNEPERMRIIKSTQAAVYVTSYTDWFKVLPCKQIQQFIRFGSNVRPNMVYHSVTTPIISASLAMRLGAKKLILYGVDFVDHKTYSTKTTYGQREIQVYRDFFRKAKKNLGTEFYLGAHGTAFDNDLPIYGSEQ